MTRIPKYLRHSSGQARTIINSKVFYLGKYGSKVSRQRYDALIAEWLSVGRSRTFGMDNGEVLMQDLLLDYLKFAKQYYGTGQNSEYSRFRDIFRVATELYSDLAVCQFGPVQFKAVRQKLIGLGWARTTINSAMKRLCRAIKWGAAEGKYPAAVYETLRLIPALKAGRTEAKEPDPVLPVDLTVVEATLQNCSSVVSDMIRLQLLTGCRPGEVCKLTPKMIQREGEVWQAKLTQHKTAHHGKNRVLLLGPKAQEVIKPYLLRDENECLFRPCDSEKKRRESIPRETPINCGNRVGYTARTRKGNKVRKQPGTQYTTQSYGKSIMYACRKGKLPHWSPNQLRHTRATELRTEYGLEAAGIILGHSKLETSQIYAERDLSKAIEIQKKIG